MGLELRTLAQHSGPATIREVLVSPLGVVVLSGQSTVLVLETRSDDFRVRHQIQGQPHITAVALSGKGSEVIAGGSDGFLKWWHVVSGEETCSTQFQVAHRSRSESISNGSVSLAITALASVKGSNLVAAASGRYVLSIGSARLTRYVGASSARRCCTRIISL